MYQPESQQAEMSNNLQLATSIDLKLGQIKISALKLERENLTVHKNPCSCHVKRASVLS
jgi:hypothetical protein